MITDKARAVNLIFSLKGHEEYLQDYLDILGKVADDLDFIEYAYILHDLDINEEGVAKTPHIHFCGKATSPRRLVTWVNLFAKQLNLNPLAISVQKLKDFKGAIRYLVHKDNPEKYQYDVSSIRSSIDLEELKIIINKENDEEEGITYDLLLEKLRHCEFKAQLAQEIGASVYVHYHRLINELWDIVLYERRAR